MKIFEYYTIQNVQLSQFTMKIKHSALLLTITFIGRILKLNATKRENRLRMHILTILCLKAFNLNHYFERF